MKTIRASVPVGFLLAIFFSTTKVAIAGTTYMFTVYCPDHRQAVEWDVGDIDPGEEYLRGVTGTKFPGCQVGGYNDATDRDLPVDRYSHEGAVIQGVPLVGNFVCGIFGC